MRIHPEAKLVIIWLSVGSPAVTPSDANVECCTQHSRWVQAESTKSLPSPALDRPAPASPVQAPDLSSQSSTPVRPRGATIDPGNVGGTREPRPKQPNQ